MGAAGPPGRRGGLAEAIAEAALEECERFYPVFQFVLWGGKSPGEAIAAALQAFPLPDAVEPAPLFEPGR